MRSKQQSKGKSEGTVSSVKTSKTQPSQSVKQSPRSNGWFTEKDAKKITKEVIGRFHNT